MDRLLLVTSSPRLPAGVLSWAAWEALRSGSVHALDPELPQALAVRAAGIAVHPFPPRAGSAEVEIPTSPASVGQSTGAGGADSGAGGAPAGAGSVEQRATAEHAGRADSGAGSVGLPTPADPDGVAVRLADLPPIDGGDAPALARAFRDLARGGRIAVWLAGPDGDPDFARALGDLIAREPSGRAELEVVYGSWDPPGARLLDVVAVMDRLRSPGGCPWDAAQTHASLAPYLLEEAYELLDAIEEDDLALLREELGDVLLQVVFHSRLAEERPEDERWSVDDVAGDLVAKLVHRHPHVFADRTVTGAAEVEANWEEIKAAEKGRESVTDGVPLGQPALALAAKLRRRAEKAGLAVDVPTGEDIGTRLFAIVDDAVAAGVDPEAALRATAQAFRDVIRAAERATAPAPTRESATD